MFFIAVKMNNGSNSQTRLQRGHFTLKSSGRCMVGIYNNRNPTGRPPLLVYIMLSLQVFLYLSLRLSLVVKFVLVIVFLCLLKLHIPKDGCYVLQYGYEMTNYYSSEFSFSILWSTLALVCACSDQDHAFFSIPSKFLDYLFKID